MYNNNMIQQNINEQAEQKSNTPFQFVTNITHDGPDRISFWIGDVGVFKIMNRRWYEKLCAAMIPALFVLVPLYICSIKRSSGLFLLAFFLPIAAIFAWIMFAQSKPFKQAHLYYDRRLQRIELAGVTLGSRYPVPPQVVYVEHPTALTVAVRYFPSKPEGRGRSGHNPSFRLLTLSIAGDAGTVDEFGNKITHHAVADYWLAKRRDVDAQREALAEAFQFLQQWLGLPLIVEPQIMSEDTNTRHYF